ncbi:hypothetical protein ACT3TZ_01340 [Brachybacterium sp. AOP25-B2-12]|uniref:hypothetical protein n=1 Tax=Brachybacterium sp. AOP25-B2-12 TaxID=3457710 RepID=UPI004034BD65
MTVDPSIDFSSHDPHDREELSEDPRIREAQLLERRMRDALATKEHPMHDGERTADRLRRARTDDDTGDAESPAAH